MASPDLSKELDEVIAFWRTVKLLSPLILASAGGMASLALYYIREISKSMKDVGLSLIRLETKSEHHANQIDYHSERLDRLEDHCPIRKEILK